MPINTFGVVFINFVLLAVILTCAYTDTKTGKIREDILNEKVLSAILEIKVDVSRVEEIVMAVREVEKLVDTVVVLGVGVKCDDNGEDNVVRPVLERLGYKIQRAKTNTGLGRITNKAAIVEIQNQSAGAAK